MDFAEAQKECICPGCPSYVSCNEKIAYCMPEGGKSTCIKVESGCLCPGCPVQVNKGFTHEFYCTRGNERQLTGG